MLLFNQPGCDCLAFSLRETSLAACPGARVCKVRHQGVPGGTEMATRATREDPVTRATIATIEEFNGAFARHDADAVASLMTDDCVFENTFPAPDGTRYLGPDANRSFWSDFFKGSPQAKFETEEMFACGDRCVVRWTYRWVDESGQPGHVRGVDVFRVRGGKVAEKLSYVKG
jgi:ketosteroid isomerase-like protein